MADDAWKVLPHQPIRKHAENLWTVVGTLPNIPMRRVMTVARRDDGRLVVHSAIAMDERAMAELEGWGEPAFLVVPNGYHRLDAARYKRRYPRIQVLAPAAARAKVAEVVAVDGDFTALPAGGGVTLRPIHGLKPGAEPLMTVTSADGVSLVVTDCVFNMSRPASLFSRALTALLDNAGEPKVTRLFRTFMLADRAAFRAELEALAATPNLVRFIVAHDKIAVGDEAAAALRNAARRL